uniref:Uncharacterized protein n=1 Tax=Tetraselmis sp. GSL018 TaxID=582737 RepID=A0A061R404_9CHLO|eukprot:CAMPEP_0177599456 /NCGR_PEP_ID=MMETSP0419_2-20121207/13002_1 /TAXON_ID=582737 /ORGANISM="Tetraselmis sp., Strain GSL018" /LENGTH=101 /DNA_ID=CAMNT_0019092189 /DNA_START=1 /DNA_END=306 /DNA_ORIENTATION=+
MRFLGSAHLALAVSLLFQRVSGMCESSLSRYPVSEGEARKGRNWLWKHKKYAEKMFRAGYKVQLLFFGDSITEGLGGFRTVLRKYQQDYEAEAFGISGVFQ